MFMPNLIAPLNTQHTLFDSGKEILTAETPLIFGGPEGGFFPRHRRFQRGPRRVRRHSRQLRATATSRGDAGP